MPELESHVGSTLGEFVYIRHYLLGAAESTNVKR